MDIDFKDVNINEYISALEGLAEEANILGLNEELSCILEFWRKANDKKEEIKIPWKH